MLRLIIICLLVIVCAKDINCKKLRQEDSAVQSDENASGKRTLMISKLILLPILAGVGIKFLVLLPIILSKIALLGVLSFVSSNLSLLASAVMGVRSYFFEDKRSDDDYDYDGRYASRHESHKPYKYSSHKDPHEDHRHHVDNYDPYDNYMDRYKVYDFSHPGYHSYHPEYIHHDDRKHSKKRFRPFKLIHRIKDAIKDHFSKSGNLEEKYREYDNDYKHYPHYLSDDHDYSHEMRETKYRNSDYDITNHQSTSKGKYYEEHKIPEDWSHKDEVTSDDALKVQTHQDHFMSGLSGLLNGQSKIPLKNNAGGLMPANLNLTQL